MGHEISAPSVTAADCRNTALTSLAATEIAECPRVETDIPSIKKNGALTLGISGDALLGLGYEYGDIINVSFGDMFLDVPICNDYTDVDTQALLRGRLFMFAG